MRFESARPFRQALEHRLRNHGRELQVPLIRLRKMVAFERLLARLMVDQPTAWLLKGGLALQWRLGNLARTTKDLDLLLTVPVQDVHQALVRAALLDLGDWFRFLVRQPRVAVAQEAGGGLRFQTQSLLDGRPFESFHIDVGWGDPVVEPPEELTAPSLLDFAGIKPASVLCYPVTQHIAEKVHAYTGRHASGESSRVKDLIDILLIARASALGGPVLQRALRATFRARNTHPLPANLPDPPAAWGAPFRRLAGEVGLRHNALASAAQAARDFLDPVLQGRATGAWDPATWAWRP